MPKQVRRVSKKAMLYNSYPGNMDKKCLIILFPLLKDNYIAGWIVITFYM